MGGGASSNFSFFKTVSQADLVRQTRTDLEKVDCFVANVYNAFPRTESMWMILSSKMGQRAFQSFSRCEMAEEYLSLFLDIAEFLAQTESLDDDLIVSRFDVIGAKLFSQDTDISGLIHEGLRREISELLHAAPIDKDLSTDAMVSLLSRLQTELVYVMARDLFSRFVISKHYKTWRSAESSHALATTYEDATVLSTDSSFLITSSRKSRSSTASWSAKYRHRLRLVVQPAHQVVSALSAVDNSELQHVLQYSETWLTALLTAAEALPVSFTLSSIAKREREGSSRSLFPLIYVNHYFERSTGYSRESVLGRSLSDVLSCKETEPQGQAVIDKCLKARTPCVVVLTHTTQEGKHFRDLVALKPVMNARSGQYLYVLGVQMDVTRERESELNQRISLAQSLLDSLPDRLTLDPEEEDELLEQEFGDSGKNCLPLSLVM